MSDRLAISASVSVLTMAIYVLFGADATSVSLERESLRPPAGITAPAAAELAPSPWTMLR